MRLIVFLMTAMTLASLARADKPQLVIHEWGTFTSLQNARGEAIGGINIDDEPVPAFVHALDASLVQGQPSETQRRLQMQTKGIFTFGPHPDVTMRLETPVVYFYDLRDSSKPLPPMAVDLSVTFNGGYLSQFYPNVSGPQPVTTRDFAQGSYVPVLATTTHTLSWEGLKIGQAGEGPKTTERVWTAPREVKAANVVAANGESEKFLFYRGVAHVNSPIHIEPFFGGMAYLRLDEGLFKAAWFVDVTKVGVAFQSISPGSGGLKPAPKQSDIFTPRFDDNSSHSPENLKALRQSMIDALTDNGLFPDEAAAMLNTWEASYFKSPGLRLFYIVPKEWVEKNLPMKVSVPADITRVMVGRIEMVSPAQSTLLKTITDAADLPKLGRFAGALLNDENARTPSPQLQKLIDQAGLQPAKIAR